MKLSNIHPNHLTAIEYISVIDIEKNTWQYTNGELVRGLEMTRPVLYNQYIYVVGGYYFDSGETDTNIIHIIDTSTNMVSISQQKLVYYANRIYAFGGRKGVNISTQQAPHNTNKFQFLDLPTNAPTTTKLKTFLNL
eukprot:330081_1